MKEVVDFVRSLRNPFFLPVFCTPGASGTAPGMSLMAGTVQSSQKVRPKMLPGRREKLQATQGDNKGLLKTIFGTVFCTPGPPGTVPGITLIAGTVQSSQKVKQKCTRDAAGSIRRPGGTRKINQNSIFDTIFCTPESPGTVPGITLITGTVQLTQKVRPEMLPGPRGKPQATREDDKNSLKIDF